MLTLLIFLSILKTKCRNCSFILLYATFLDNLKSSETTAGHWYTGTSESDSDGSHQSGVVSVFGLVLVDKKDWTVLNSFFITLYNLNTDTVRNRQ